MSEWTLGLLLLTWAYLWLQRRSLAKGNKVSSEEAQRTRERLKALERQGSAQARADRAQANGWSDQLRKARELKSE